MDDDDGLYAGTWASIKHELGDLVYEFFHVIDEVLHAFEYVDALDFLWGDWRVRFCGWCHRKDV